MRKKNQDKMLRINLLNYEYFFNYCLDLNPLS